MTKQDSPVWRRKDIQSGRYCVRGTRVPIGALFSFSKCGYSVEEIVQEYPSLTVAQVSAALRWAFDKIARRRAA